MKQMDTLFNVFQRLHPIKEFEGAKIGPGLPGRIITRHKGCARSEGNVSEGALFFTTGCWR